MAIESRSASTIPGARVARVRAFLVWATFVLLTSFAATELIAPLIFEDPVDDPNLIGAVYRAPIGRFRWKPGRWTTELGVEIHINDLGFRSRHPGPVPPRSPDTVRIAVIGDSESFCGSLAYDDCFPGRLETTLSRSFADTPFEVLGFAIGGTNTLDHEQWLEKIVLPLEPDLVILSYVMNDIELFDREINVVDLTHWYDRSFVIRSARYALSKRRSDRIRHEASAYKERRRSGFRQAGAWANYLNALYESPDLWAAVRNTLLRMKELCDSAGVAFLVTSPPPLAGVSDFRLDRYPYRQGRLLLRRLAEDGIEFIEPLPAYESLGKPGIELAVAVNNYHHGAESNHLLVDFVVAHPAFRRALESIRSSHARRHRRLRRVSRG